MYLACFQCSDPLPEAVSHSFRDHGIQQGISSLLLFVQLLDDFLQLSILLLLLEDKKKWMQESTVTVSPLLKLKNPSLPYIILLIHISPA